MATLVINGRVREGDTVCVDVDEANGFHARLDDATPEEAEADVEEAVEPDDVHIQE